MNCLTRSCLLKGEEGLIFSVASVNQELTEASGTGAC